MSDRSTVKTSTLTVKISESIQLGGQNRNYTTTSTIDSVRSVWHTIIPVVSTAETLLYTTHASTITGNQFDKDLVEYVRITNRDNFYDCDLIIVNGEDTTGDEVGIELKAGKSLVLWGHDTALDATTKGADVATTATSVVAATTLSVADGDAADGMTNGQYLQLISTDGTTKNYVLSDTSAGGVATGTILVSDSDIGSDSFGNLVTAVDNGVAVGINMTTATQYVVLKELKTAIEHLNGHNGKILCTSLPGAAADGAQNFTITQAYNGAKGNTVTTTDITNLTSADFSSGVTAGLTGKSTIDSVSAQAQDANVDLEIFVASR